MQKNHKYKIGDIVIHAAVSPIIAARMVITAVGSLKNEDGEILLYQVSGAKDSRVPRDDMFFRTILEESEIKKYDDDQI